MKDKFPKIYKNKIENIKSKVQNEYYYHANDNIGNNTKIDKQQLIKKIENIFKNPNYIYQANVNIMYKNGKNIEEKVVAVKDNYLLTLDGKKIFIDDINDIK